MSDVDTAPSVPATLDAGQPALALEVNHRSPAAPSSPRRASPPPRPRPEEASGEVPPAPGAEEGDGPPSPKADSEAETIIQSGRESLSPQKRRKYIEHEPTKRRDEGHDDRVEPGQRDRPPNEVPPRRGNAGEVVEGRKPLDARDRAPPRPAGLPPRPPSPPSIVKLEKSEELDAVPRKPEPAPAPAPAGPRLPRKRSLSEVMAGDGDAGRPPRHHPVAPRHQARRDLGDVSLPPPSVKDRSSMSPVRHTHKRAASGPQLGGGNSSDAAPPRKKKAPTPLVTGFPRQSSEDRQSVSSSTSGSPLPTAHLRKLVDGASASPARPTGSKKQRDQNGRTRLARACAAQELEAAIARHSERPDDLNVADNAGNTPLQIASLEGCAPIVKFLLEAGCEIDTKNIDKDTPLIDAVENGHLDVVKLLLAAGANPRTLNAEGDEPYDLVPSDSEEFEEIRRVIADAKANPRQHRRSEERASSVSKEPASRRVSNGSGRDLTPVHGPRSPPPPGPAATRRKVVRREATRNDLLWTKATPENLQAFAAKGDMEGVANILNVGQKADPESMIAAAKGGHDEVISLLLGMGDADPDPDPVAGGSHKPGYNTPMLAAIGRGNLAVIRILLDNPDFNPARRLYRDRTYYELSRDRRAENWEDEYDLLRDAYEKHVRAKRQRKAELASSPRRARDKDKENKRPGRRDSTSPAAVPRKSIETGAARPVSKEASLLKEKRRDGVPHPKDRPGVPRPKVVRKEGDGAETAKSKGMAPAGKDHHADRGDDAPKRRRLFSGRPPADRERRRPSVPSDEEGSSARPGDLEGAKSGLPAPLKRGRSSASPERPRSRGTDPERPAAAAPDGPKKKRRVLNDDGTPSLTNGGGKREQPPPPPTTTTTTTTTEESHHPLPPRPTAHDGPPLKSVERDPVKEEHGKQERRDLDDIPMVDADNAADRRARDAAEADARRQREAAAAAQRRAEEARLAAEAEQARLDREAADRAAQAERLAQEKAAEKAAEEEKEERRRKEAEQRRAKQAEDERQKRLEQERLRLAKQRREQEELEQRRREGLPSRLRIAAHLVGSNDAQARSHAWLRKFLPVVTAETRQLDPTCDATVAEDRWVPNYLVAPLLATNDLQLSQYASWEKRDATPTQRMNLWRVTRRMLVQADEREVLGSSWGQVMQKDSETRPKYFEMEHVFWVKVFSFLLSYYYFLIMLTGI